MGERSTGWQRKRKCIPLAYALLAKGSCERLTKGLEDWPFAHSSLGASIPQFGDDPDGFMVLPKQKPGISGKVELSMERGLGTLSLPEKIFGRVRKCIGH